jgi:hypothetical protein
MDTIKLIADTPAADFSSSQLEQRANPVARSVVAGFVLFKQCYNVVPTGDCSPQRAQKFYSVFTLRT